MIDITYLPTLSLLLTALHYVVSGTMHYAARARFLEWTVSVPVMMLGIASLSGVTDASVLAFVAICSMASMLLGLVHEGSRNTASQTTAGTHTQASDSVFHRLEDYVLFFVSALLMIMVWASIGAQLSRSKPPSFVYAIVVLECIGFALFPVIHVRNMTLAQRETMHMYVGLVVKSILCIVQTAGTRSIATDAGGA